MLPDDIFCNPLALPDYPLGIEAFFKTKNSQDEGFCGPLCDYRDFADAEVLYDNGVWYMVGSGAQGYVSRDFVNWTYRPFEIEGEPLSYAPSLVRCHGRYLLTASRRNMLYVSSSPQGPYKMLGAVKEVNGAELAPEYLDPALFADEDGRLFLYWGCSPWGGGIYGVELDPENPTQAIGEKRKLLEFEPSHAFERFGEYGEEGNMSWMEGASMFKHNDIYYLQYATNGTVFRHYSIGVARSLSPLGPFRMQHTPVCQSTEGLVCGTGHGGWAQGPDGRVWQFYLCSHQRVHCFERCMGMDRVEFQPDGEVHVRVTNTPQSVSRGDLGLVPVSVRKQIRASSWEGGNFPAFVLDECPHTWWAPAADDAAPWIEVNLRQVFGVQSLQIWWADLNLDYENGVCPEAVRFKVEFFDARHQPVGRTLDFRENTVEKMIDLRTFETVEAQYVKVSFLPAKNGCRHGITALTAFARPISPLLPYRYPGKHVPQA